MPYIPKRVIPVIELNLLQIGQKTTTDFGVHLGNITIANGLEHLGIENSYSYYNIADCVGKYDCKGKISIVRNEQGLIDLSCQGCPLIVSLKMKPAVAYHHWLRLSAIMSLVKFYKHRGVNKISYPPMKAQRVVACSKDLETYLDVSHVIYFASRFAVAKINGDRIPPEICEHLFPGIISCPEIDMSRIERSF